MKITCIVGTYNETERLPGFFDHATKWADEILQFDKSSTDNSVEIGEQRGAIVRRIPFSRAGFENVAEWASYAKNDWCFFVTPGETPTRELIDKIKETLADHGDKLDLIYVPKKLYSFGIFDEVSPWSISHQPFLINRARAKISRKIHATFEPSHPSKAMVIPYSETCHVLHPTHRSFESFVLSHCDYALAEFAGCADPRAKMAEAIRHLRSQTFGGPKPELVGQMFAWRAYWSLVGLAAFEKKRGGDATALYKELTESALREWDK